MATKKTKAKAKAEAPAKKVAPAKPTGRPPTVVKITASEIDPESMKFLAALTNFSGESNEQTIHMMIWYMRRKYMQVGIGGVWASLKQATPGYRL